MRRGKRRWDEIGRVMRGEEERREEETGERRFMSFPCRNEAGRNGPVISMVL